MSVRRLAEPHVQPPAFAFSQANASWAEDTIRKYPEGRQASAVIPLLMRAQEQEGWVTKAAIEHVAQMLDMPFIRVLEVATFYTQFQLKPVGTRAHVQVCGTTPCMLRGSEDLMRVCKDKIHPEPFHPNETGTLSWEEVECLGACVNAPMVMIFKDAYEDLTPERLAEIIDSFEAGEGASVPTGPQNGRIFSAPAAGLTSLTDEATFRKASNKPARSGGTAAKKGDEVSPTLAAKPKTDAPETDPRLKSPSRRKADPAREAAESVEAPRENETAANLAEPSVEGKAKTRHGKDTSHADVAASTADSAKASGEATAPVASAPAAAAPRSERGRPVAMQRPDQPDDLKLVSGVGPRNERLLNELGIYTYAQIAAWKKAERDWVDSYLKFKGRIEREDWVKQAKALAKGGEAEYIRVFGKKPR